MCSRSYQKKVPLSAEIFLCSCESLATFYTSITINQTNFVITTYIFSFFFTSAEPAPPKISLSFFNLFSTFFDTTKFTTSCASHSHYSSLIGWCFRFVYFRARRAVMTNNSTRLVFFIGFVLLLFYCKKIKSFSFVFVCNEKINQCILCTMLSGWSWSGVGVRFSN